MLLQSFIRLGMFHLVALLATGLCSIINILKFSMCVFVTAVVQLAAGRL
jgi:hypothetical protein